MVAPRPKARAKMVARPKARARMVAPRPKAKGHWMRPRHEKATGDVRSVGTGEARAAKKRSDCYQ